MIPVFVISLAREPQRRAAIVSQLDALKIPRTIMDAVDGRLMSDEEADRMAPGRRRLTLRWPLSKGQTVAPRVIVPRSAKSSRLDTNSAASSRTMPSPPRRCRPSSIPTGCVSFRHSIF